MIGARWPDDWPEESTPAHSAASQGAVEFLQDIVEFGMPLHYLQQQDLNGNTPAHIAARCGHDEFLTAIAKLCLPAAATSSGSGGGGGSSGGATAAAVPSVADCLGKATGVQLSHIEVAAGVSFTALDKSMGSQDYAYAPVHVAIAAAQPRALAGPFHTATLRRCCCTRQLSAPPRNPTHLP